MALLGSRCLLAPQMENPTQAVLAVSRLQRLPPGDLLQLEGGAVASLGFIEAFLVLETRAHGVQNCDPREEIPALPQRRFVRGLGLLVAIRLIPGHGDAQPYPG